MLFRKSINTPYVPASILGLYQEGGQVVQGTPANMGGEMGGEDPMQQVVMAAQQAVQTGDGELALQVCTALVQMIAGASQQAPAEEPAPMEEEMPMEEPPM